MKGQRTIPFGDDTLTLRFTFGAVEDFCEQMDINFSEWEKEVFTHPKNMRLFIYHMAKADADDLSPEDLRELDFFQAMGKVNSFVNEAAQEIQGNLGEGASP